VRKADNLPPSCADVKKSGGLNLLEPCGLFRPVMGQLYLLPFIHYTALSYRNQSYDRNPEALLL
jgi:hypothetical protein